MRPLQHTANQNRRWQPRPLLLGAGAILCLLPAFVGPASAAKNAPLVRTQVRYDGTLWYEGHAKRPHDIGTYHSKAVYSADGRGRVRLDWTTWAEGDSAPTPESYLVVGDSVFHRDAPGAVWKLRAGDRRRTDRLEAAAGLPQELGRVVREQSAFGRGEFMFEGQRFIYVEKYAHPRLGDVVDTVAYTYQGTEKTPFEILMVMHYRDAQWRLEQRLVAAPASAVPDSLFDSPASFDRVASDTDSIVGEPKLVPLAPGLWSADMEDIDSRSMFVEFADHLAIIEFAVGSANGERLIAAARRQWPTKPIRYAFFSHHHPHYLGALRTMIAEGATVVTTPGNEAYVKEIGAYPFTLQPDRLARSPKPVKVRTFKDRFELADSTNQLIAINYGERSQHTDEFVIFWFPRAKLLFEAEQGWVTVNGTLRASRRAVPLLAWIAEQKLDVERIIQSWPMRGDAAEVSRAKLEELAKPTKR